MPATTPGSARATTGSRSRRPRITRTQIGATPVPIDVGNTLMSVQAGVVDGFDNTPLFATAGSWYQGLDDGERHIFLSRHSYQPAILVYSKKWFDKLPKDVQKVLTTADYELVAWGRQQVRQIEPVLLKNLAKYGYEIYEPSDEELAPFKANEDRLVLAWTSGWFTLAKLRLGKIGRAHV